MTIADSDGQWTQRGGVLVLVPPPPPDPVPTAEPVAALVACPLCRARLSEPCLSTGGNWVPPHDVRLVSRRCPCGNRPREGSHFCTDQCRDEARTTTYREREKRTPTRMRRKSATTKGTAA